MRNKFALTTQTLLARSLRRKSLTPRALLTRRFSVGAPQPQSAAHRPTVIDRIDMTHLEHNCPECHIEHTNQAQTLVANEQGQSLMGANAPVVAGAITAATAHPGAHEPVISVPPAPFVDRAKLSKRTSRFEKVMEIMRHMKHSLKLVWKDTKTFFKLRRSRGRLQNFSIEEFMRYQKIKVDLLKFIPYSFFIVVPASELLIPFYIWLLPNSTPSQFSFETNIGEANAKREKHQKESYLLLSKRLEALFPADYVQLKETLGAIKVDPLNKALTEDLKRLDKKMMAQLISNWPTQYAVKLDLDKLSVTEHEALLRFFFANYLSGVHIVKQFLNVHKISRNLLARYVVKSMKPVALTPYRFDVFPLNTVRSSFLDSQLSRHFARIRAEDQLIRKDPSQLEKLSSEQLYELTRRRGLKVEHDRDRIKAYREIWDKEVRPLEDIVLQIWVMLFRYPYAEMIV